MAAKLYETIAQVMSVPISSVDDESSPETIATWDSFHALVLIDELEAAFDIKFTLDEIINTRTVADIKKNLSNHGISVFDK